MDPALKLDIAIGLLTRRSKHLVKDPHTGKSQVVLAEPLLVQLRMASTPSSSTDGGGASSTRAPIPLNADAHDLLERIEEELTAQWWYTHPTHRGRGRESLVGKLLAWTTASRGSEVLLLRAGAITARWVEDIEGLFNPQRRRPLPGVCPNKKCGAARVFDREEEGEHFYRPALVQVYDDDGLFDRLECGVCGSAWSGLELELMGALAK